MFTDRKDAGSKLALKLQKFKNDNCIVLAIPRGGIVTAYETIKKFKFQWDLIIPRKIGLPSNKEIAIGGVTSDGTYILNEKYINIMNVSQKYIKKEIVEQIKEIKRRLKKYKANENFPKVKDKTVIIIDDGIATGSTLLAAIKSIKKHGAKKIILAVPVAPYDTLTHLKTIVDEVICLLIPNEFYCVGFYYKDFKQTTDEEVIHIINKLNT